MLGGNLAMKLKVPTIGLHTLEDVNPHFNNKHKFINFSSSQTKFLITKMEDYQQPISEAQGEHTYSTCICQGCHTCCNIPETHHICAKKANPDPRGSQLQLL
jgi:hypothetical protein